MEKQQKAEERKRKAAAKQEEVRRKAEEKERKAAEWNKIRLEKEAEKKKREQKRFTRSQQHNKENEYDTSSTVPVPTTSTVYSEQQNVCSVCLGKYEDDVVDVELQNDVVDDELQNEWICCSNCDKWMHLDCVIMEGNSLFFVILSSSDCHVTFNPLFVINELQILFKNCVFFHALSTKTISVTTKKF